MASKKSTTKKSDISTTPEKKRAVKSTVKSKADVKKKTVKKAVATKSSSNTKRLEDKAIMTDTQNSKASKLSSTGTSKTDVNFAAYTFVEGEEYMNDNQRKHFDAILSEWRGKLMEEVDRTVHHMQDEAANFPDPNDRATQESEFAMELRTRDRERRLIKKINESLDLLDDNEYGYCEQCGVEIGVRRLEARPTANLCIDCKTLDEIREKQLG